MTSLNLQKTDVICPRCKSDDTSYSDTNYYPDYSIELWECNDCNQTFELTVSSSEILNISFDDE